MGPKQIFAGLGLALAGLAAAVAIGLLANSISGDSVGLSAEPLSAGDALAPPAAARSKSGPARRAAERRRERRRSAAEQQTAPPPAQTPPPVTDDNGGGSDDGLVEPGDDKGGLRDNSGSGSDDSGSDDSGSGGHGSDD